MNKVRAFVAVNLSVAATRAVAELEDAVRRDCEGLDLRVAWVPPPNLHVTLKFLGWTREESLEAVRDRLAQELARSAPIDVRTHGLGAFPTATRPRVIWVGLDDTSGALCQLAETVDQLMSELGFIKEERPFKAHMTIGRVKEGRGSLEEVIARHADRDLGVSSIREVVLYESKLRAQGAEYTARARIPLGAASVSREARPASKKEESHDGK